jgi:hypothetical protein
MHLLFIALSLLAQGTPLTNLTISGAESAAFTNSNTNACYIEDDVLSAQLSDPSSSMVISMRVKGTVGDHPAQNQLTVLTMDGPADDPFVNWSGSSGTVTLDDVAAQIPVEGGDTSISATTSGVLGHIQADLTSSQGSIHVSGPFACHSPV